MIKRSLKKLSGILAVFGVIFSLTAAGAASAQTTVTKANGLYWFSTQLHGAVPDKLSCIVALYDKNGSIMDLSVEDMTDGSASNVIWEYGNYNASFARVYIWSTLDGLQPYTKSVMLNSLEDTQPPVEATENNSLNINGTLYSIGMSADRLPEYDDTFMSNYGYPWYVYGTDDYSGFFAACVADGKIVRLVSAGKSLNYCGTHCGNQVGEYTPECGLTIYTDKNDNNIVHAVELYDKNFRTISESEDGYLGESKINFYMTNAFRVYHGKAPLVWSDTAATAARLHSVDMATQNYFSHTSLDGTTMSQRLTNQGISWFSCGENISAGRYTGTASYDGWVNSAGHRDNMLREGYKYLGVGGGYSDQSTYGSYFTQDYYA